ncbi:MAG: sulfoxide reductase heme-binding subunit YedZ [Alphaproteobacteria bacterium]|nr:sulfoxide reductase heme-binding subunit YedZ [Alphaproteobacteria bacterium]
MALTAAELRRRSLAPFTDKAGTFAPLKAAVFVLVVAPGVWIAWRYFTGNLGGFPLKVLLNETGLWGLRFIIVTLAITPLRRVLQWPKLITVRRMIGIAAFTYSAVHLWVYVPYMAYDWGRIGSEVVLRFYLLVGTIAVLAMLPLAVTSTDAMVKRLGGARWRRLHQFVYAVGVLAMLHFYLLLIKTYDPEGHVLAGSLVLLLLYRVLYAWRGTMPTPWLIGLSIFAAAATMIGHAAFFAINSNGRLSAWAFLSSNFTLDGWMNPGWIVLALGLGVTLAGWIRQRVSPKERRRGRLDAGAAAG